MGTLSLHVSDELENLINAAHKKTAAKTKVSKSRFLADLLENAIHNLDASLPSIDSQNALVELTKTFHPTITEDIESWCQKQNVPQKKCIAHLLSELANFSINTEEPDWRSFIIRPDNGTELLNRRGITYPFGTPKQNKAAEDPPEKIPPGREKEA